MEAPLIAKQSGDEVVVAASPSVADAVEGSHDASDRGNLGGCVAVSAVTIVLHIIHLDGISLDTHLEGLQVDFTSGLLIQEGCNAVLTLTVAAVVFLIVDGVVLDENIHTTGSNALTLKRSDMTADKRVFRVILAVAARECSAMHIDSRSIPAINTQIVGFIADVFAIMVGQIIVVGLCQNDHAAVRDVALEVEVAACIEAVVDQAGGRVTVGRGGLIHRLDGSRAVAGLGDQGLIIAGGQLVEQRIPLFIIVIQTAHIDQAQTVVLVVNDLIGQGREVGGVQGIKRIQLCKVLLADGLAVGIGCSLAAGIGAIDGVAPGADLVADFAVNGRPGASPVTAGEILQPAVCMVELIGDLHTGRGIELVGRGVHSTVCRGVGCNKSSVAVGGHAVRHSLALGREDVVDRFVCVFGCGDIVIACIQNVGLGIDVVVRLQLLLIKGDRYGFACAGSQLCSFGIAHQLHSSLFHLVCLVVIGIGALCIDLYDILTGHITRIGDLDRHGAGIAIPAGIVIRPLKIRVGQAVSKGIHHSIRIVVITGIALTQHLVLVAGLVVAVANIDALFVADVVVLGQVAVLVIVGKVAKVLGCRAVHGIHLVGVHGAAGRIHLAGEDLCQRAQTVITHSGS